MKNIPYLLLTLLYLSCQGQNSAETITTQQGSTIIVAIDTLPPEEPNELISAIDSSRFWSLTQLHTETSSSNYTTVKQAIEKERANLQTQKVALDSVSKVFEQALVSRILPFWNSRPWSFEGHTSKPNTGTIACGYLVSTTLLHIGLNLNRYQLAQQSPINEAKSLAITTPVKEFQSASATQNIADIKAYLPEGIHFIGFDASHVGYILKKEGELYLIHSNYYKSVQVELEQIECSKVFASFDRFYIVELSTNNNLLQAWLDKTPITVIKK